VSKVGRALISVSDKTGIVDFGVGLSKLGVEIISTGGTAKMLRDAGIAVQDISEITGMPEILDGRVKTLHPAVHGGILGRRSEAAHVDTLAKMNIGWIDMVVVNLYPFETVAAQGTASFEELIENIDIGGPTMIRSAAKNFHDVAVVTDAADYPALLEEMKASRGELSLATKWRLAQKAIARTARYDAAITSVISSLDAKGTRLDTPKFPDDLTLNYTKLANLRYGENPHQQAALYATAGNLKGGLARARQLQGKELSFNNLVDLEAAWNLVQEFSQPAAAVIKHTNPCGCSIQATLAEAYLKAYEADPISAYGGVLGFNRPLDAATAEEVAKLFVEAIVAPGFSAEALKRLESKKNLRLVEVDPAASLPGEMHLEQISGGLLVQDKDRHVLKASDLKCVTKRQPTPEQIESMLFAWNVCKHVKSNAIVYARGTQLLSTGAGQMSRVDSVKFGAAKAQFPLTSSVLASDAFFPFPDGIEEAANAGAVAFIQPGGSIRDDDAIAACDKLGASMVFTGVRHFRH
jgi:phosphoribosylaminoimidazolecarboxamide formyltransferase / IMP cyclohydrolase